MAVDAPPQLADNASAPKSSTSDLQGAFPVAGGAATPAEGKETQQVAANTKLSSDPPQVAAADAQGDSVMAERS